MATVTGAERLRARRTLRRWPFLLAALLLASAGAAYVARPSLEAWLSPPSPPQPEPARPVRAVVNGVALTVPRDLVRFEHQKQDAELPRLDLAFQWPPPSPAARTTRPDMPEPLVSTVFLAVSPRDDAVDPARRLAAIYNRFLDGTARQEADGLVARPFREGVGYDGEELAYDPIRPAAFFVRCALPTGDAPATCLRELRLGDRLDVVVRFPRGQLADWRRLDQAVMALLAAIGAPQG